MSIFRRLIALYPELKRGRSDNTLVQFIQNAVASVFAFAVDFGLLLVLTELVSFNYLVSGAISFFCGHLVHYFFCILWIFPKHRFDNITIEIAAFLGVGIAGIGMNALTLWFFTEPLSFDYKLSKLFAVVIVYFFNFFSKKFIVFHKN